MTISSTYWADPSAGELLAIRDSQLQKLGITEVHYMWIASITCFSCMVAISVMANRSIPFIFYLCISFFWGALIFPLSQHANPHNLLEISGTILHTYQNNRVAVFQNMVESALEGNSTEYTLTALWNDLVLWEAASVQTARKKARIALTVMQGIAFLFLVYNAFQALSDGGNFFTIVFILGVTAVFNLFITAIALSNVVGTRRVQYPEQWWTPANQFTAIDSIVKPEVMNKFRQDLAALIDRNDDRIMQLKRNL